MPVALEQPSELRVLPRLGFAGLGWIGAQRMQVLAGSGIAQAAAICEPDAARLVKCCTELPQAPVVCATFEDLLEQPLEGVVIATPNALHEQAARAALERGIAVFCQKPLALSRAATEQLVELARRRGVSLGVDFSYRHLAGMHELRERVRAGEIGAVIAAELCFHNAYGPGASWYYDVAQSGGGCLLDLGCHLLDLCHWLLGLGDPAGVSACLFREGRRQSAPLRECEDFAVADLDYPEGARVHLACSWRAPAGRGAVVACRIYGTSGGAEIVNVGGSFYDFEVSLTRGAECECLGAPPDAWPGRALVEWARNLARPTADELDALIATAGVIDRIYGRGAEGAR